MNPWGRPSPWIVGLLAVDDPGAPQVNLWRPWPWAALGFIGVVAWGWLAWDYWRYADCGVDGCLKRHSSWHFFRHPRANNERQR
jgi:hypothetical protein